jgi:hypothetical protein
MSFAIRKPRNKLIFISENYPNDLTVGCNEAFNLVECIKREEFEVKCKRKYIENYE